MRNEDCRHLCRPPAPCAARAPSPCHATLLLEPYRERVGERPEHHSHAGPSSPPLLPPQASAPLPAGEPRTAL